MKKAKRVLSLVPVVIMTFAFAVPNTYPLKPNYGGIIMKKALSLLLLCFALLGICSCQKKIYTDPEEYSKYIEKSESKAAEESSKQQVKIEEDIAKLESELGKTEKNKQLIVKKNNFSHRDYEKIVFKNGKANYRLTYVYYDNDMAFDNQVEFGDKGEFTKLIDKNKTLRCLLYKTTDIYDGDFTYYFDLYQSMNYEIIQ